MTNVAVCIQKVLIGQAKLVDSQQKVCGSRVGYGMISCNVQTYIEDGSNLLRRPISDSDGSLLLM